MSLFGSKKETPVETPVIEEPVVKPEPVQVTVTRIGQSVSFVGDITTEEEIVIEGSVKGNIKSNTSVTISKTGDYEGDAEVRDLVIEGRAHGKMLCDNSASISDTGRLTGELETCKLITVEGSVFDGRLKLCPKGSEDVPATEENIFE